MPPKMREIVLNARSPAESIPLVLETGMREIDFLRNAVPKAWRRLAECIGFAIEEALRFQAFIQALLEVGVMWFRSDDLPEIFTDFVKERGLARVTEDRFRRLLDFFSAPPEIIEWGIAVPFLQFGDWFAYWPFAHHVLPPSLTFLCLLMRKHPDDWNNTVGSELAKVADAVCSGLPVIPGLFFATRKTKAGIGDIDLCIYDSRSHVLLLCEIKTVFDRFRTNYQMSNFVGQRVNFAKAAAQLAVSANAIKSGAWKLSVIFNRRVDDQPPRILSLILTWYDQHNPWVGIESENPQCCNFRVFQYLFKRGNGNLVNVHEAIAQLSRIYCAASLLSRQYSSGSETVLVKHEVQMDLLPPEETLRDMPLSNLVKQELGSLQKLPIDWREQLAAAGQSAHDYHIYGFDEQ